MAVERVFPLPFISHFEMKGSDKLNGLPKTH
jgi:hypothetical protein